MLNWTNFKKKIEGKETEAFENLAYFLFCEETKQEYGVFEYKDQWGIETEPVEYQGKLSGFQAKFYTTRISDNKKDIIDSIDTAKKKHENLNQIFLYLNDSFKESTKDERIPKFQKAVEDYAASRGIEIVWRVPSHIDYMLHQCKNQYLLNYFFEDWELPKIIVDKLKKFNNDLMEYPSTTNEKEYSRPQQSDLEKFVDSDDKDNIALLAGNAGMGKSVLTKQLLVWLYGKDIPTLAIKADYNQFSSIGELERILCFNHRLEETIKYLVQSYGKMVVIIDQIDALSLTLSKDRHDLEQYKHLINLLTPIVGLRIIVSCREYDLNYDTFLQPLEKHHKIRVGQLEASLVKDFVQSKGVDYESLNDFTKNLLSVPLHLYIFCTVYTPESNINFSSLNDLYDRLWNKYINESISKIDTAELQKALKAISFKMYECQELTIEAKIFVDNYGQSLTYLESSGLIKRAGDKKIQFFHQSFFDYIYARSYVNDGGRLYEDILEQHQGFFIRARIKQVLDYLRAAVSNEYKENVRHILTGDNYKLHIKFLVLNTLVYQLNPSEDEKMIFDRLVKPQKLFYYNFMSYVWSGPWLDYMIDKGYIAELLTSSDNDIINLLPSLAWRRPEESKSIIKLLDELTASKYSKKDELITNILCNVGHLNIEEYNKYFLETYNKWGHDRIYHFLGSVSAQNPKLVVKVLKSLTEDYYTNLEKNVCVEYVPDRNNFLSIAKDMGEQNKKEWTEFLMWFIDFVSRKTVMPVFETRDMNESWAFHTYSPNRGYYPAGDIDAYYADLSHNLKELAKDAPQEISAYLCQCRNSNFENLVALAATSYIDNIKAYLEEIKLMFMDVKNYDGSTWLTYNMVKLLEKAFVMLDATTQEKICDILYDLHPKWELFVFKDRIRRYHSNAYGETAYKYMKAIPEDYIKNSKLKDLFIEYSHKFKDLKNEPPDGISVRIGDPSLPKSAYDKMSIADLKQSFLMITTDHHDLKDWDKPTVRGHAQAFAEHVEEDWEKYKKLIIEISSDSKYNILYSVHACFGLSKAKADVKFVAEVIERVIQRTDDSSNYSISILNSIEYIINNNGLTDPIFDYIYNLAYKKSSEYPNEDDNYKDEHKMLSFSYGTRGLAAANLIMCYGYNQYADRIFEAMFKIADDGNLSTRIAVIYSMAFLQNIDAKRNIELFYALQKPTMQKLVEIPISSRHPLLYMIVSDFKALKPYFDSIMIIPEAGIQLKVILLIAWLRGYEGAEELLKRAMSANLCGLEDVFRQAVESLKIPRMKDKAFEFIMKCLDLKDETLGKSIDLFVEDIVKQLKDNDDLLNKFIDKYIISDLSRYQRRVLYDYLKKQAGDDPQQTLRRLKILQENTSIDNESYLSEDNIFEVLVRAYNSIYKFNKDDELLNDAINLFDDILKKGKLGYRAFRFLNDLEK